ncbi:MAG: hypothetical protein CSB23_02400 [Deltaproteobacteria bacterium]|nr:MAG: hypothetical protein CSB23_02400 [Deltaproteobacteria bacterium]
MSFSTWQGNLPGSCFLSWNKSWACGKFFCHIFCVTFYRCLSAWVSLLKRTRGQKILFQSGAGCSASVFQEDSYENS